MQLRLNIPRGVTVTVCLVWLGVSTSLSDVLPRAEPLDSCFLDVPAEIHLTGGADCGYVVVPQSRAGGGEGEVRIAYMRLKARTSTKAAPLFMLAGGPGGAITREPAVLQLFQDALLGPLLDRRDVVLMEQRGTMRSRPYLDCPGFWSAQREAVERGLDETDGFALLRRQLLDCVARHKEEGVLLTAYNNVENAADVNDVRAALGYQQIVYYGASYGTKLGQHVMRDFPGILEAVVLDGTGALSATDWTAGQARNAKWGIDNLVRLCSEDAGCAEDYDIRTLLDSAFALFDEGPIVSVLSIPAGQQSRLDLRLTAEEFAGYLHSLQTSKYGVMALPALLNAYVTEGRSRVGADMAAYIGAQLLVDPEMQDADMTILMHLAMICSDDPPRSLEDIEANRLGRYEALFARSSTRLYVEMCRVLDLPELPASIDVPVETNVPVLVLSGGLDFQTPYFISQGVVDSLPNATHVIFPAGFHVQVMNINPCAIQIARNFVENPSAPLDLFCVTATSHLSFLKPDFTVPEP
jgi:pimeloyl-ACP methyl ester carboxylesterase